MKQSVLLAPAPGSDKWSVLKSLNTDYQDVEVSDAACQSNAQVPVLCGNGATVQSNDISNVAFMDHFRKVTRQNSDLSHENGQHRIAIDELQQEVRELPQLRLDHNKLMHDNAKVQRQAAKLEEKIEELRSQLRHYRVMTQQEDRPSGPGCSNTWDKVGEKLEAAEDKVREKSKALVVVKRRHMEEQRRCPEDRLRLQGENIEQSEKIAELEGQLMELRRVRKRSIIEVA